MKKTINQDYLRNIMFGAEDSLVSSVGVLFGLAASGEYSSKLLVLTGVVLIFVEALSMGVGSYLTETEVHELDVAKTHTDSTILDGIIMFVSYILFGSFVIIPYAVADMDIAKYYSVGFALLMLFIVGYLPTRKLKDGIRMLTLAGLAILLGFTVAKIF